MRTSPHSYKRQSPYRTVIGYDTVQRNKACYYPLVVLYMEETRVGEKMLGWCDAAACVSRCMLLTRDSALFQQAFLGGRWVLQPLSRAILLSLRPTGA